MISALIVAAALRIISLAPSLTESLFAIGAGPSIVAVDSDSTRPAAARKLTRVGRMLGISTEKILSLRPDLVVGIPYQAPLLAQLQTLGVHTRIEPDGTIADIFSSLTDLGIAARQRPGAQRVINRLHQELQRAKAIGAQEPWLPGVVIISTVPIYVAARPTFIDELLNAAHIRNLAAGSLIAWPQLSAEQLTLWQPQLLITPSDIILPSSAPWNLLHAVEDRCVIRIAADDLLRPGPRVGSTLHALLEARARLKPDCQTPRHSLRLAF